MSDDVAFPLVCLFAILAVITMIAGFTDVAVVALTIAYLVALANAFFPRR